MILTDNIHALQEDISKDIEVLVSTTLNTSKSVAVAGWTIPEVLRVERIQGIADCELHRW